MQHCPCMHPPCMHPPGPALKLIVKQSSKENQKTLARLGALPIARFGPRPLEPTPPGAGTVDNVTQPPGHPQHSWGAMDVFWAEVAQNWTFWLSYLVCCRWACWFAQRCFTMCRHTLVAQHFCPISIFLIFLLFVAKSDVFFLNGIFPI